MTAILQSQPLATTHPDEVLREFFQTANAEALRATPSESEVRFVHRLVQGFRCRTSLELGCGHGVTSLAICVGRQPDPNARHLIIDPHQTSQFGREGVQRLRRAGIENFDLVEQRAEFALPELVRAGRRVDFAFVDARNTPDHTSVDLFYLARMIEEAGVLVVHGTGLPAVRDAVTRLAADPSFELVGWSGRSTPDSSPTRWVRDALGRALQPLSRLTSESGVSEAEAQLEPETLRVIRDASTLAFRKFSKPKPLS